MSRRGARGSRATGGADAPRGRTLRVGLKLDDVIERTGVGDAVVIDVLDMDRPTARRILATGAGAVLNVAPSYSGRFPVTGPALLVESGIELIDDLGSAASLLRDGERVDLRGDEVMQHGQAVATGRRRYLSDLAIDAAAANASSGVRIRTEAFVSDTIALLRSVGGLPSPAVPADLEQLVRGRAVVLIVGPIEQRAAKVLSGLPDRVVAAAGDVGAEAAAARGLTPQVVVGGSTPRESERLLADESSAQGRRRRRGTPRTTDQLVAVEAPPGRPVSDGAAMVLLSAGARSVVLAGAEGVDDPLMGLLDRPRTDAASTGLLRLDAAGRIVAVSAVESLTAPVRSAVSDRSNRSSTLLSTPARRVGAVAAAVAGALVVGAVLGAGPLARFGPTGSDLTQQQGQNRALAASASRQADVAGSAEEFLASVQQELVAGKLTGRRVVIVSAAGIESSVIEGVSQVMTESGATVAGTLALTAAFTTPNRQASLDDIAARLAPAGTAPVGTAPGDRVRAALITSIVTATKTSVGTPVTQGQGLLDALTQVGAVQVTGTPSQRSDLVVLVVPDQGTPEQSQALANLGRALAVGASGTVMSTPGAAAAGSAAALVTASPPATGQLAVSDEVARPSGRIALVRAFVTITS